MPASSLISSLEAVRQQRVYFGHQSVGADILGGVERLSERAGIAIRITEVGKTDEAAGVDGPCILHQLVGHNGDPASKLAAFVSTLTNLGATVDVAMLKFCYADIGRTTDVQRLFERVLVDTDKLREAHRGVRILSCTAPLTCQPRGMKERAKRWLGRGYSDDEDNIRRHEYNELLRAATSPTDLFDLAAVEAAPDEAPRAEFEMDGKRYPRLSHCLTTDGGHLNQAGAEAAARTLLTVLAGA